MRSESLPLEHGVILEWIEAGSSVLDLGCGDGELLSLLVREKKVKAQGIEIDEQAIYRCVARGLSVFHQDIDNGLSEYADKSFDYVILNQSFQQVKKPDIVLTEALRVSRKVIISFPNFAHYRARLQIFFNGKDSRHGVVALRVARYAQPPFPEHPRLHRVLPKEKHHHREVLFCREGSRSKDISEPVCADRDFLDLKKITLFSL